MKLSDVDPEKATAEIIDCIARMDGDEQRKLVKGLCLEAFDFLRRQV